MFNGSNFKKFAFCETLIMKIFIFPASCNGNCNGKAEVIPDTKNMQKQTACLDQSVDQIQP